MPRLADVDTTSGVCPSIAGKYLDAGDSVREDGSIELKGLVSLTYLIDGYYPTGGFDVVEIREANNRVIEIESFRESVSRNLVRKTLQSTSIMADSRAPATFICEGGFTRIFFRESAAGASGGAGGAFIADSRGVWIRKAEDGSLVTLEKKNTFGLFFIVPFGSSKTVWSHFPMAPTERQLSVH